MIDRARFFPVSVLLMIFAACTRPGSAQEASVPAQNVFKGGASAITETHRDWTVNCRIVNDAKTCSFMQVQTDRQSGKTLLTIEFNAPMADELQGGVLLPFGLQLAKGVKFDLDDKPFAGDNTFSTCLEQGCLVPLTLKGAPVDALRAAKGLKIIATNRDGQSVTFGVSLAGFASSMNRSIELISQ